MTEVMFPGGICRVDETLVWRKLADWLSQVDGREVRMRRSSAFGDYVCQLNDDGQECLGRSMLSAGDALAQALQISLSKEAS